MCVYMRSGGYCMVQAVCNISDGTVAPHAAIQALNDWGGFTQHAFASVYKEGAVMANASVALYEVVSKTRCNGVHFVRRPRRNFHKCGAQVKRVQKYGTYGGAACKLFMDDHG